MSKIIIKVKNIEAYEDIYGCNPNYGGTLYEVVVDGVLVDKIHHEHNEYNNPVSFASKIESDDTIKTLEYTGEYKQKNIKWGKKPVDVGFILSEGKAVFLAYSFDDINADAGFLEDGYNTYSGQSKIAEYLEYLYS